MRIILCLLFTCLSFALSAQKALYKSMRDDHSNNFYEVVAAAEAYFDTIDKYAKGSGYKGYMRWKNANEYKYYPDGDRTRVDPYLVEKEYERLTKSKTQNQENLYTGWKDLGPYSIDSITGHYAAGIGRIEDFYVDPLDNNNIYQGSRSGGFWATTDGGMTWQGGVTDFLFASGVNCITASPTNIDSVLINVRNANNGTSHGIYRSINGGASFAQTAFNPVNLGQGGLGDNFQVYEVAYHPRVSDLIFVGTSEGIYKSTDNLLTWTLLESGADIVEIAFHPTNDDIIYLYDSYWWSGHRNQILYSTDQGASYSLSNVIPNNNDATNIKLQTSADCPNCVYVASSNGVWHSLNNGVSFVLLSAPGLGCGDFAVDDTDRANMIVGYLDIGNSTDGGQNFNQTTFWSLGNTNGAGSGHQNSYNNSTNYIHADLRKAKCVDGIFYAATDGFLSRSDDQGVTWTNIGSGVGTRENYRLGLSQSNHFRSISGSQDNGTSIKMEDTWIEFYGADGMEALIHPLNEDWMMGSVQYGSRRLTKDGGQSQSGASPSGSSGADWIAPLAYDSNDHMTIYDFRDVVYKSTDFTSNYVVAGSPSSFTGNIQHATIAQNNSDIILISRSENIDKSIDGGLTFSSIKNNLPSYSIQGMAFDPKDDNTIVVVYARYQNDGQKVFRSTDGGSTWNNITHNLGNMPIRSVVIDHTNAANIYLGAEIGVYTMPMSGNTWTPYNLDLANTSVRELEINYGSNTIKAATWGRGLWEYNLVGRQAHPAITHTTITTPPTASTPKATIDQFVSSKIHYTGTLSSVFVEWSQGSPTFGNTIAMTNTMDTTWVSDTPLPNLAAGTKMFFRVKAVGASQDTSVTYKFMYEVVPFEHCAGIGSNGAGNLYLSQVSLPHYVNNSNNDIYINYVDTLIELKLDESYLLSTTANTGWSDNDHTAWIDFNKDAEFTLDERILFDPNTGSNASETFTVPSTAMTDDTLKMRVRLSYWGSTSSACGETLGEVEDYQVVIQDCNLVTTLADSGRGSLREAIACAEPGATILFHSDLDNGTIIIDSEELILDKNLTLQTDISRNITVASVQPQVNNIVSVFDIDEVSVMIIGLKISGGFGLDGSAIRNKGSLVLQNVVLDNGGKTDINSTLLNYENGTVDIIDNVTVNK